MTSAREAPEAPRRMLVVDDKANMRTVLESAFTERGFEVAAAASGEDAIQLIHDRPFDIVITDLSMPGKDGMAVLKAAKAVRVDTEVIIITAYGTIESAVEAMRLGACDFLAKPFKLAEIERKVEKILEKIRLPRPEPIRTWIHPSVEHIVGSSPQTRQLMKMITRIAPSNSSVLITGPSGVGKELVAKAIHEASPRRNCPFVALNCAALAPGVLESELFGHEKGAFTGAASRRIGRFEKAHTGTLFLDEVGEIDPGIQIKLLRVLQDGEFERVGGMDTVRVDCRIVAATNRDIQAAIEAGHFREDFYYRLKVFSFDVPPLSQRREDIPALLDHFLRKFSVELGKDVVEVDDDVFSALLAYPWPGNVRELENVIERGVVLAEGSTITRAELPPEVLNVGNAPTPFEADDPEASTLAQRTLRLERELIEGALDEFHWNKTKAAEHLGIKRTTLQYKIKKYGLE